MGMLQDIRYAGRSLVADRTYVLAATLTLALGIGVNIAVVSAARAVFFPSLPFAQAQSLVALYEEAPSEGVVKFRVPYTNYLFVSEQKRIFSGVALYVSSGQIGPLDLTEPTEPKTLPGAVVSANFFEVLGVKPMLGQTFLIPSADSEPQSRVVIGYQLWKDLFGGKRSALGKPVVLNGRVYNVVGVMPPGFRFPSDSEVWLAGSSPSAVNTILNSNATFTEFIPHAVARLQPGIAPVRAQNLLLTPLALLTEPHLEGSPHVTLKLVPLYDDLYGNARRPLIILTVAASFVLLIAWVVVSILCWVRAIRRQKEIAIRTTLGAGKWRTMTQFLAENGLISLAGTAAALLVYDWTAAVIPALAPAEGLPRSTGLSDWHFLLYLAVILGLSAMVPGVWSATNATKLDLARVLQEGSYSSSIGRGSRRLLSMLVALLVGLAFVLTAGAALMIENFRQTTNVSLGWDPANVWALSFDMHGSATSSQAQIASLFDSAAAEIERMPGISAAAIADAAPIPGSSFNSITVTKVNGSALRLPVRGLTFETAAVSPDYFRVLGIPLLQGRWFTGSDCVNSSAVAIVDQSFARRFWGQSSPVGQQMTASRTDDGRVVTIIGVVGATRNSGYLSPHEPIVYTPVPARLNSSINWIFAKMQGKSGPSIQPIRKAFASLGSGAVPSQPHPAEEALERAGALPRARAEILLLFGVLALVLAIAGSYGVTAYVARQRVHEVGIRMALGASRGAIAGLVLSQVLWSLAVGLAGGWVVALGAAPIFRTLLYRAQAADLSLFAVVSVGMSVAVLIASLFPAWRTATLDPATVLRKE